MPAKQETWYQELESAGRLNRTMFKLTGVLGLTTGIGVIVWGLWSLIATLITFFYEESGVTTEEILISNGLNEGLLLSAVVIALGVIVLELKKIQDLLQRGRRRETGKAGPGRG